jgi:hypothetical protein
MARQAVDLAVWWGKHNYTTRDSVVHVDGGTNCVPGSEVLSRTCRPHSPCRLKAMMAGQVVALSTTSSRLTEENRLHFSRRFKIGAGRVPVGCSVRHFDQGALHLQALVGVWRRTGDGIHRRLRRACHQFYEAPTETGVESSESLESRVK